MSHATAWTGSLLVIVLLGASTALAQQPVASQSFSCDDGREYWVFAEGRDASCRERAPGLFECSDASETDAARGGCEAGCAWKRYAAGCQLVIDGQLILQQGVDLECPDGRVYHIEDDSGTCRTTNNRTSTGTGECSISDGTTTIITVQASCTSGCTLSRPGTDCKCTKGCGPPDKK